VDWTHAYNPATTQRVELPTYAFQRHRYWLEAQEPADIRNAPAAANERLWQVLDTDGATGLAAELKLAQDAPLSEVASALSAWRVRRQEQSSLDSWRYQITWKPTPSTPSPALPGPKLTGTWLIVRPSPDTPTQAPPAKSPGTETAKWLSDGLTKTGTHVVTIDIAEPDLNRPLLAQRLRETADKAGEITGVISLLAERETLLPDHHALNTGLAGTLLLTQALGDATIQGPLWCLTRGAVTALPDEPLTSTAQAQIWGLGRVIALEHPDRWGGLIDLPHNPHLPDPPEEPTLAHLCHILTGTTGEDQLAIRPTGVLARRLEHTPPTPETPPTTWDPQGTILITGGTGALGSHIARWLAQNGARNLLLTSRRGPDTPGAETLRTELNTLGTQTTITACDITDHQATAHLLTTIPPEHPLTAIFHTAGRSQIKALEHTSVADLADVVSAKVQGAKVLDELLHDRKLDCFVLFSSVSGIWGSGMQGGYAAGNAFLDALVQQRRDRGLAGTSVAWGPWAGGGMAAGDTERQLRRIGLPAMPPELAVRALDQVINGDQSCVTVADVDWPRFTAGFTATRPSPLI
ncbi:SDR family NAD(P)-dependent oxidoreductase, partial [Streptomyces sp. NPDC002513]